jgi:acyl-[acyl-carrier-protein]-phospholipid O-acyltransferase/long-chain-fatty-acid--[acyl-carrier-protein] ligase
MSASQQSAPPEQATPTLKTFGFLNAVMFQGALSDNLFKYVVSFLGISLALAKFGEGTPEYKAASGTYTAIAAACMVLPFMLVATFAGSIADKYSKARVTLWTKLLEVAIMGFAVFALAMNSFWFAMAVLFFMGMQSALFSPAKYGILPEIVPHDRVGWANGVLQGATFVAIIVGTLAGPTLYSIFKGSLWIVGLILVGLALAGTWAARQMETTPSSRPDLRIEWNPVPEVRRNLREIRDHDGLAMAVAGMTIWWLCASMLQATAILMGKITLGLSDMETGYALLPISIGIGAGCFLAGRMSKGRIELGLVPIGAMGMFVTCIWTWFAATGGEPNPVTVPLAMGAVGFFAGFFCVPLQAYIVDTPRPEVRGGVWAAQNFVTGFGMIAGAGLLALMTGKLGLDPADVFLTGGIIMLTAGIFMCVKIPDVLLRFKIRFLFGAFYRLRVRGLENVPRTGGGLFVCNHQSFLDGVIMAAAVHRPVRFMMSDAYYNRWWIWPFAKLTHTIPISNSMSPRDIIHSLRTATEAIKGGDLLCIYAEGQITRHGHMLPFRRGYERIMRDTNAPVIPVAIDGLWNSSWSMQFRGMFKGVRPRFSRRPINIAIGTPLKDDVPVHVLRQAIMELMVDAFELRREDTLPLQRAAVRNLRARPFAKIFSDPLTPKAVSRIKALTGAIALGKKLRHRWADSKNVGLLLPPSTTGAIMNLTTLLAGKTSVNINYTMSIELVAQILKTAGVTKVVTSRAFLEKLADRVDLQGGFGDHENCPFKGVEAIYLEDIRKEISAMDRISALFAAFLQPVQSIERALGTTTPFKLDDIATLIFSSGSTGVPKGVMLSHWNIISNVTGARQVITFSGRDYILGILPFFHSFGYLATLWLPYLSDVRAYFFPNPLDARAIGVIVEQEKITHLLATPTFLQSYARRITPEQFGSLRFVLTGAEKLRASLADEFHRVFGIRPVEAYGATETSPAVSVSTTNVREPGIFQVGSREGWIGHPIPGVAVRIADPDTGALMPPNEPGMLMIKGPNVMIGYFNDPEKTSEVIRNGWYISGDIAKMDTDGFIQITDRLSRFSKIGGEMVPHLKIEEALQEITESVERMFAVTGIPDEKKGERLIVLYSCSSDVAKSAAEQLGASGLLPNLWIPKFSDFIKVEEIPVLGTGKTDLRALKDIAMARTAGERAPKAAPK